MSQRKYTLPGMTDWIFQIDNGQNSLLNKVGVGFYIEDDMTADDIAERIENILRKNLGVTDQAAINAVVQASRNIDWQKTIAKPLPELVASLVNEPPAKAQTGVTEDSIAEICGHLKAAYFAVKKLA